MRFSKMHGIGNDFILVNAFEEYVHDPSASALAMCRNHFGIGADGLVLVEPSDLADFGMRVFNRDGSEARMCGNAVRCIGRFVYERGMTEKTEFSLHTLAGIRQVSLAVSGDRVLRVSVDMGTPDLDPRLIPVDLPGEIVLRHRLSVLGQTWFITCVSMGNPHCVIFVRDPDILDLGTLGPMFENHPLFPQRTNVEFVRVVRRDVLQIRVWERGAGETLACATGACASLVAAVLCGLSDRTVQAQLAGGNLEVVWNAEDNHLFQAGPAEYVFDGEWQGP